MRPTRIREEKMKLKKLVQFFGIIIAVFTVAIIFTSCSSPESNGKKVGEKYCNCRKVYEDVEQKKLEITQKEYSKFAKGFNSYKFQNRLDVRSKVQEIENTIQQMHHEADKSYRECLQKAEEYYQKIDEKYATNKEKREKFNYARNNYRCQEVKNNKKELLYSEISNLRKQMENLRLTVIPPKPDIEKIKCDLIGRTIVIPDERCVPNWSIKENIIKDFQIVNESKGNDKYSFEIRLFLQRNLIGDLEASVNVTYVLRDNDDWKFDSYQNRVVKFVKTGDFDNCIAVSYIERKRPFLGSMTAMQISNSCDVTLVVTGEFRRRPQYPGQNIIWTNFSETLSGKSGTVLRQRGLTHNGYDEIDIIDYKIHCVVPSENQ